MFRNIDERKDCPMRHESGNCMPLGGFCANAVSDEICHALHNAYNRGVFHAMETECRKYRKFSDGWFTYYVNVKTGKKKWELEPGDIEVTE